MDDDDCPICWKSMLERGNASYRGACGHAFHVSCLNKNTNAGNAFGCPTCSMEWTEKDCVVNTRKPKSAEKISTDDFLFLMSLQEYSKIFSIMINLILASFLIAQDFRAQRMHFRYFYIMILYDIVVLSAKTDFLRIIVARVDLHTSIPFLSLYALELCAMCIGYEDLPVGNAVKLASGLYFLATLGIFSKGFEQLLLYTTLVFLHAYAALRNQLNFTVTIAFSSVTILIQSQFDTRQFSSMAIYNFYMGYVLLTFTTSWILTLGVVNAEFLM